MCVRSPALRTGDSASFDLESNFRMRYPTRRAPNNNNSSFFQLLIRPTGEEGGPLSTCILHYLLTVIEHEMYDFRKQERKVSPAVWETGEVEEICRSVAKPNSRWMPMNMPKAAATHILMANVKPFSPRT